MIDKQPTQEQIKTLWEWCGFTYKHEEIVDASAKKVFITASYFNGIETQIPQIDLNNLFRWAVPKLRNLTENNTLQDIEFHWQGAKISDAVECNLIFDEAEFDGESNDPALALFWAICEVIKK